MATTLVKPRFALLVVAGPRSFTFDLTAPGPVSVGRRAGHGLELAGDERVSRDHATMAMRRDDQGGELWLLTDNGSKHGTYLNGVRLSGGREAPLRNGDTVTVTPWTFRVLDRTAPATGRKRISPADDGSTMGTMISTMQASEEQSLARHRLALLLECAETIASAVDESALAERVIEAAVAGAGFANAAMLRPLGEDGSIEIIATRGDVLSGATPSLSRSLIERAARGEPARLTGAGATGVEAQSIVDLRIEEAVCAPIMLAATVAGFLYLDNRGSRARSGRAAADAGGFTIGLARLAAMALANLRRVDVERRYARLEADLFAGAEAQRWILPPREGRFGAISYIGKSRPGRYVGGDFFDVIPLDQGRLAVALADVSGKGIPASVLMTASQGFLHAALRQHGDPGKAVTDLNRFVHPRRPSDRFLTMWVGVFDPAAGLLRYVDAGHGYALLIGAEGATSALTGEGGLVGVDPDARHDAAEVRLPANGRALVVSDGLIEQPGQRDAGARQFGKEGLRACIAGLARGEDAVEAIFSAVERHAGSSELADDATAVLVEW